MEPTYGNYDRSEIRALTHLRACIVRINNAPTPEGRADRLADVLLNGHRGSTGYLTFGNHKLAKNIGIFNMNSATDCPNADSDEENPTDTGVCQVPWDACYAHKSESQYGDVLDSRRRQEILWDHIDAETMARAFLRVKERKTAPFDYLRVSQSGDFRHNGDIRKWEEIARLVSPEIQVYTYSASHKLDAWHEVSNFTVNQSNALAYYGDRLYSAVESADDVPDGAILCPFDAAAMNGKPVDERPKCGECTACIEPKTSQPRDVFITISE
jgi:hypothetical protein